MKLTQPVDRPSLDHKTAKKYDLFARYIHALNQKELTESFATSSNEQIELLNKLSDTDRSFKKQLIKTQTNISNRAIKELKYVPKNHYRNVWLAVGMAAFGIPFGVALSTVIGNFAFIGLGLPIGLSVGIAYGTSMDQRAAKEGRQLDIELSI